MRARKKRSEGEEKSFQPREGIAIFVLARLCRYSRCWRRGLSRGAVRLPVVALVLCSDQALVLSGWLSKKNFDDGIASDSRILPAVRP